MKYLLLLFGCCSLVYALTDEFNKRIVKIREECNKDPATRCSDGWVKAGEPSNVNLEGEGAHIFCRTKKFGSLTENGDIDKKVFEKNLLKSITDPAKVKAILEKCGTRRPGTSPEQSAIDFYRCIHANK